VGRLVAHTDSSNPVDNIPLAANICGLLRRTVLRPVFNLEVSFKLIYYVFYAENNDSIYF
jgi:hypothetical protein